MTVPVIRLDRSKPFSECHGDRTPEDPHYNVHFWQAFKVGDKKVNLPFDAQGLLVHDDGKAAPFEGRVDGKPIMFHPLYDAGMRDVVEKLKALAKKGKSGAVKIEAAPEEKKQDDDGDDAVNFASWLRGEVDYPPQLLKKVAKERLHRVYNEIPQMVVDLVLDDHVVPENEVCPILARHLPPAVSP